MTRTLIDIDDAALAEAARALGTNTTIETVNRALKEIAGRKATRAALDDLLSRNDDLGDPDVMAGAWR